MDGTGLRSRFVWCRVSTSQRCTRRKVDEVSGMSLCARGPATFVGCRLPECVAVELVLNGSCIGVKNKQPQEQRQNTGILRCAQDDDLFYSNGPSGDSDGRMTTLFAAPAHLWMVRMGRCDKRNGLDGLRDGEVVFAADAL